MKADASAFRQLSLLGGVGILTLEDLQELTEATERVYQLMKDGRWHTRDEIELAAGTNGRPAREGLRRMRELRQFCTIEKARQGDARAWWYRLVKR